MKLSDLHFKNGNQQNKIKYKINKITFYFSDISGDKLENL